MNPKISAMGRSKQAIAPNEIAHGFQCRIPEDRFQEIKNMSSADRGRALIAGLDRVFPWEELARLQRFEAAALKNAQNILGKKSDDDSN